MRLDTIYPASPIEPTRLDGTQVSRITLKESHVTGLQASPM
jgi:hypothetical protein